MNLPLVTKLKGLAGKTVLLRLDFNITVSNGKLLDLERIIRSYPTLDWLLKQKAKVILISHRGRPKHKDKKLSLRPVSLFLRKKYKNLVFVSDCRGPLVKRFVSKMKPGSVVLLENLRFYKGEEENSNTFARDLAKLADIYVNDAFAVSHRAHASVHAILNHIPGYAGLNLASEVENIDRVLKDFKRPAVAILGGIKISTKIDVIKQFAKKFDRVLIGGALANNFLVNQGYNIGQSVYEKDYLKKSGEFLKLFKSRIVLPIDLVLSDSLDKPKNLKISALRDLGKFPKSNIVDIGPKTQALFSQYIKTAMTLVWNGPLGLFEVKQFEQGTKNIAKAFSNRSAGKCFGLAGGGEDVAALNQLQANHKVDFVSTGGGAMLEYIEKGSLPALEKLIKMHAARTARKNR